MAEAGATSDSGMKTGHEVTCEATDLTLSAESSREPKRRRATTKEASIEFLDSAKSSTEVPQEVETTSPTPIDEAAGKVGGGTMQCGAAAGQESTSESTVHSEVSADYAHASADLLVLGCGESVSESAVVVVAAASYKSLISSMARANESNIFTAENYYLLYWLYRIRHVSCLRGLRISFLQPDFLWSIYRPMMRSKKLWRTDGDIRVAADLWCFDRAEALKRYGHISDWDVSSVTDMSRLFQGQYQGWSIEDRYRGKDLFNDDISRWDVSKVMFDFASAFNQPLGNWDVSNVTNMEWMFYNARSFNQAVGDWNVSKVTNISCMFFRAVVFNQPVGGWDVSKVTDMGGMFEEAQVFNQDLTRWDIWYDVSNTYGMFRHVDTMQRENKPVAVRDDVYDDIDSDEGEWEETEV